MTGCHQPPLAASLTSFPSENAQLQDLGQRLFPLSPPWGDSDRAFEDTKLFKPLASPQTWDCILGWILEARQKTKEPIFSRLCYSSASKQRRRKKHPLDISIRQIDSCCNGWSRKLQPYWLGNVQHGHVDRVSENLRTWLRLALIKNDLPGASSQKAMSHSLKSLQPPSVF